MRTNRWVNGALLGSSQTIFHQLPHKSKAGLVGNRYIKSKEKLDGGYRSFSIDEWFNFNINKELSIIYLRNLLFC